jgi:hypothetical protein
MLMGIGALALVASLFNLVAPKAVRATAAALVEVANTGTAPALTLDISKSALQHVELTCGYFSDHCVAANTSTPYVVPTGQNLVVTSVDISTAGTGGRDILSILTPSGAARNIWAVPNDGFTHSFQYPSGIVFSGGFVFMAPSVGNLVSNAAFLNGFLTSN